MSGIGVIGGADGPTAVFVTGPVWPWITGAAALALVLFLLLRRRR